jgi:hypothetical protein
MAVMVASSKYNPGKSLDRRLRKDTETSCRAAGFTADFRNVHSRIWFYV